jgi:hypothetical protein
LQFLERNTVHLAFMDTPAPKSVWLTMKRSAKENNYK